MIPIQTREFPATRLTYDKRDGGLIGDSLYWVMSGSSEGLHGEIFIGEEKRAAAGFELVHNDLRSIGLESVAVFHYHPSNSTVRICDKTWIREITDYAPEILISGGDRDKAGAALTELVRERGFELREMKF